MHALRRLQKKLCKIKICKCTQNNDYNLYYPTYWTLIKWSRSKTPFQTSQRLINFCLRNIFKEKKRDKNGMNSVHFCIAHLKQYLAKNWLKFSFDDYVDSNIFNCLGWNKHNSRVILFRLRNFVDASPENPKMKKLFLGVNVFGLKAVHEIKKKLRRSCLDDLMKHFLQKVHWFREKLCANMKRQECLYGSEVHGGLFSFPLNDDEWIKWIGAAFFNHCALLQKMKRLKYLIKLSDETTEYFFDIRSDQFIHFVNKTALALKFR